MHFQGVFDGFGGDFRFFRLWNDEKPAGSGFHGKKRQAKEAGKLTIAMGLTGNNGVNRLKANQAPMGRRFSSSCGEHRQMRRRERPRVHTAQKELFK
jgi:hypothetical protein